MKKKIFILTLGLLCLTSSVAFASSSEKRIYGDSKYETSAKISSYGFEKSKYAILVNGEDFADGLSASPLAKKYDAPLLITPSQKIDNSIKSELQRLEVKNVIIVGGNGAVSNSVEDEIKSLGISTTRISGKDRYDTSLEVAKEIGCSNGAFIAVGDNYADALSASSIAGIKQMPILLTPKDKLPDKTYSFIKENNANKNYILGSPLIISENIDYSLKNTLRIYGIDRYATNLSIIDEFSDVLDISNTYIASGQNFHDALCVSSLASKNNGAVILGPIKSLDCSNFLIYNNDKIKNLIIVGDENVIDENSIGNLCNTKSIKDFSSEELMNTLTEGCMFYRNRGGYSDSNNGVYCKDNPAYFNYKLITPYETKEKLLNVFGSYFSHDFLSKFKFNKIDNNDYIELPQVKPINDNYFSTFLLVNNIDYISDKYCVASIWSNDDLKYSFTPVIFTVEGSKLKIDKVLNAESYYDLYDIFISFFDKIQALDKETALSALNKLSSYVIIDSADKNYIEDIRTDLNSFNGTKDQFKSYVENMKNKFIKSYNEKN